MKKKQTTTLEMRYYNIPKDEYVLALYGESWTRNYEYIMHIHNLMEIGMCIRGSGSMWLGEERIRYAPGMITIIPENFSHTTDSDDEFSSSWEYLYLDIGKILYAFYPKDEFFRNDLEETINRRAWCVTEDKYPELASLLALLMSEVRQKDVMYRECQKGLCQNLLFHIVRMNQESDDEEKSPVAGKHDMEHIQPAVDFIHEYYSREIKISELAAACHMSESHFRRKFEECTRMTPGEYLNAYRIKKACDMIRGNKGSMAEIAEMTGFLSISTFNRNFKNIFGVSPNQWKKNSDYYRKKLNKINVLVKKGW